MMTFKQQLDCITDLAFTRGVLETLAKDYNLPEPARRMVIETQERVGRTLELVKIQPHV